MGPSRAGRAGQTQTHIILAGAPSQAALLQSAPSEGSHQLQYLPAFRRFFRLDGLTAVGPGLVSARTLTSGNYGSDDPISKKESPWRELPINRTYSDTAVADSEGAHQHRRVVQRPKNSHGITKEVTTVHKPTTLTQHITISFTTATSVGVTSEVDYGEGEDDDGAAAAQLLHDESAVTSFNRSHERSQTDEDGVVDVDFLNHSFACYETAPLSSPPPSPILSSPLPASSNELDITTSQFPHLLHEDSLNLSTHLNSVSTSFHTSFNSLSSSYEEGDTPVLLQPSSLPPLPPLSSLTDLEDLPTAKELEKIQSHNPQNPFCRPKPISSIVGIISISQPTLCRNKSEMVKLTVGDETASGVGVAIWLGPGCAEMRDKLCNNKVKPLDVILLRNVSLNTYMGKVYMNSMRNGKTGIDVLYRCGHRGGGYRPDLVQKEAVKDQQVEKVRRVVEWVECFVGTGGWGVGGAEERDTTILPEDTQIPE